MFSARISPANVSFSASISGSSVSTMDDGESVRSLTSPLPPLGSPIASTGTPISERRVAPFSFSDNATARTGQALFQKLFQQAKERGPLNKEAATLPRRLSDADAPPVAAAAAAGAPDAAAVAMDEPVVRIVQRCLGKRTREDSPPASGLLSPPATPELRPQKQPVGELDGLQVKKRFDLDEMSKRLCQVAKEEVDLSTLDLEILPLPMPQDAVEGKKS